eukprot:EG_transcript_36027
MKCPVCLELFDDPVLLSCPHSVCRTCASQLVEARQPATVASTLSCPLCQETTQLPKRRNGVMYLKRNVHLQNVVQQLRKHAQPTCGRCEKGQASCGCKSCGVLYCSLCRAEVHTGALALHAFVDVETFLKAAQRPQLMCQEHAKKRKLYCPECTQLVCTMCGTFGVHKDHGCKPIA